MTRRAEPKQVKKRKELLEKEKKILAAVEAYQLEQAKPPHLRKGVNKLAIEHGVNGKTVLNRFNGMQSISQANAKKQQLSPEQEKTLADLAARSSDRGRPLTKKDIQHYATTVKNTMSSGTAPENPLGKNWVNNFLTRQSDLLQTYRSKHLDTQRAQCLNPQAVKSWFDLLEEHLVKKGVRKENILAMDECGFIRSNPGPQYVVGRKGKKNQYRVGTANRETVTALVTICADGTYLPPSIIFKGERLYARWTEGNVAGARYGLLL